MDELQREINRYLNDHWDGILEDIESLVRIESTENLGEASEGAPYGPGPRAALDQALAIAKRMGLNTYDCEGHIGYADLPGESDEHIGIIGHVDVVPAGPGWTVEPYAVTRREGYLLGRGVLDDKGPIVVALHAVKFWADKCGDAARLPYTLRVLFGANEETNMKDVAYYRAHYDDPALLITPDAQFPVCYGEAGICSGTLTSAPIAGGMLRQLAGGVAVNAVPGEAHATLSCDEAAARGLAALAAARNEAVSAAGSADAQVALPLSAGGVGVEATIGGATIHAQGKSAHASTPEVGVNAIDVLAAFLLDAGVLADEEKRFFELARKVTSCSDGSGLGVQVRDDHFGALTSVGGTIVLDGDRIRLTIDFRYPTTTSAAAIEQRVQAVASEAGATFVMEHDKKPFLMDPDSSIVRAMLDAYNEATGENAESFTMKGGTYARAFSTGVSFGPVKLWEDKPDWVGGMHGPDEGVSEELLKQEFAIYARTIEKLMRLEL